MAAQRKPFEHAEGSMSKLKASEVAVRACEQAIQTLGGWGYIKDFPVEKWYRDAKLYTIFEGTSEIQRLVIGRALRAAANTEPLDQRMQAPRGHHKHHRRAAMSGHRGGPGHHGHGPGGWGSPGERGGPRGWGGGRRRRMRRGDVRAAMLVLLDEQPHTGYRLIEEIERRSSGAWRPSPGSVYPTLAQLEDEGLVRAEEGEGRMPFTLTDAGKAYVAENREELGEPWAKPAEGIGEGASSFAGWSARSAPPRSRLPPRATTPRSRGPRSCSRRRVAASTRSWPTTSRAISPRSSAGAPPLCSAAGDGEATGEDASAHPPAALHRPADQPARRVIRPYVCDSVAREVEPFRAWPVVEAAQQRLRRATATEHQSLGQGLDQRGVDRGCAAGRRDRQALALPQRERQP